MHKNLYIFLCYQGLLNYHETTLQNVGVLTEKDEYQRPKIHNSRKITTKVFISSSDNSKETTEAVKWNSKGKVRNTSYFHFSISTFLRKELKFYWTYKVSLKWPPSFISKPTNFFCPKTFLLSSVVFFFPPSLFNCCKAELQNC